MQILLGGSSDGGDVGDPTPSNSPPVKSIQIPLIILIILSILYSITTAIGNSQCNDAIEDDNSDNSDSVSSPDACKSSVALIFSCIFIVFILILTIRCNHVLIFNSFKDHMVERPVDLGAATFFFHIVWGGFLFFTRTRHIKFTGLYIFLIILHAIGWINGGYNAYLSTNNINEKAEKMVQSWIKNNPEAATNPVATTNPFEVDTGPVTI